MFNSLLKEQRKFETTTLIALIIMSTVLLQVCLFTLRLDFNIVTLYERVDMSIYLSVDGRENLDEGYFVVFSDFHSNPKYSINGIKENFSMCIEDTSKSRLVRSDLNGTREKIGAFGDHDCDAPMIVAYSAINKAKNLLPNPNFVIWLGDSLGHIPKEYATDSYKMQIIANLSNHLTSKFPQTPIFPLIGNHDGNPKQSGDPSEFTKQFERLLGPGKWDQLITDESQQKTFHQGGFYSSQLDQHTLMIFMNGFLHYHDNQILDDEDPFGQFKWLQEQLENAKKNDMKVLLFNHFSMGKVVFELSYKDVFKEKYLLKYISILENYGDLITAVFMGHSHTDTFRLIENKKGPFPLPGFVHTSMSSFQTNPSFRVYKYSMRNGIMRLDDYWQYYLDLKEANELNQIDWKLSYKFTDLYRLPDLTGRSLELLHQRLDESLHLVRYRSKSYRDFFNNLRTKIERTYLGECNKNLHQCERMNICATKFFTQKEYTECIGA